LELFCHTYIQVSGKRKTTDNLTLTKIKTSQKDVARQIKIINDFIAKGVNNYTFNDPDDMILTISGLRGAQQFQLAIDLYQKHESTLKQPDFALVALTNIIEVCNYFKNIPLLIKYAKEMKLIAPDHPFVITLSKTHPI
jgi:hypothetical protein